MRNYYIAFDTAFKPRGKIDENYTNLRDHLNANNFICYNFLEVPITQDSLKPYDILVFVCPDFAKIPHQEINEIENWVREDGGGLLLLSHAGGDKGRNSNLSELSERFGIAFENDQVLDEENNLGMENLPIVSSFNPPHPITEGIDSLCYRAGCSLTILGGGFSIASSNESSDPFSCPLICVSEADRGRVCAIGSYEMFRDRIGGGFSHDDHAKLATHIFNWLVSDYRIDLRSGEGGLTPAEQPAAASNEATVQSTQTPISSSAAQGISIDSTIKISNKSDLINLLTNVLGQLDTLRGTVENLINSVSASEDEIVELQSAPPTAAAPDQFDAYAAESAEGTQMPAAPSKDLHELKQPPLSALPPKPPTLLKKTGSPAESDFFALGSAELTVEESEESAEGDLSEEDEGVVEEITELKEEVEEAEEIDKEELMAEIESLESKLNSFFNLLSFIEKKHNSGNMPEKAYKKQTGKLKKDIDKTKKRMEEIKEKIEN